MKIKPVNIITAVFISLLITNADAADGIYGSAGVRSIYSEDEQSVQQYYKPFASIGWQNDAVDINASYNRWISYTITDELYNSSEIDLNQAIINITYYAGDMFSFSGGYSLYAGESSYSAYKVNGEATLYLDDMDICLDGSIKNTDYDFNGSISNSAITGGSEISFDITDNFSWDLGYQYEYTDYKTYGYTYARNSLRAGVAASPLSNIFLLGGITTARDSDDIISAALDAGLTLKLYDHIKVSAAYMLTAEYSSSGSITKSGGGGGTSSTTASVEISHTGSIAISLYF